MRYLLISVIYIVFTALTFQIQEEGTYGNEVITSHNASLLEVVATFQATEDQIKDIDFNYNGNLLAIATNRTIYVTNPDDLSITKTQLVSERIENIEFHPYANILAIGREDGGIQLWNVDQLDETIVLHEHNDEITDISFSSDGDLLASTSYDQTIIIWDLMSYTPKHILRSQVEEAVQGLSDIPIFGLDFSPDNYLLAAGGNSPVVFLYDAESGELIWQTEWDDEIPQLFEATSFILGITFTSDGAFIAHTTANPGGNHVRILDALTGGAVANLRDYTSASLLDELAFTPDNSVLAVGGYVLERTNYEEAVKLWNWQTEEIIVTLDGNYRGIESLQFSPSGKLLAIAERGTRVDIWAVPSN